MVEGREKVEQGFVLVADGRVLIVSDSLHLSPPEKDGLKPIEDMDSIQPGVFVRYDGHWNRDGLVEVAELTAWGNELGKRESKIYQKYDPKMLLPMQEDSGPPVLKIGKNRYEVFDGPDLQLYVDQLGTRLLPEAWKDGDWTESRGYRFWFLAAVHQKPHASAFPSGVIVVHSSLFHLVENEAQLAFAIAHEIAHVVQEHAWQEYRYHRRNLLLLRWSTAGIGYVVESAIRRGYQRDLEAQADRLALWYMSEAGYDPREGIKLLLRLKRRQGLSSLVWDTHRSYGARGKALANELAQYSARGALRDELLGRTNPDFVRFRDKIPRARIETTQ
jgi:hypothetical protein